MRLFRTAPVTEPVATMLRCMERGEFLEAHAALRRRDDSGPLPPPHALWRLGRRLVDQSHAKRARHPLELFLELYPNHEDRADVMHDLAHTLAVAGKRRRAERLSRQAKRLAAK